jgi:hypothetical protein
MKIKILIIISFLFKIASGQVNEYITVLDSLGQIILSDKNEKLRLKANSQFDSVLVNFIHQENPIENDISAIKNLSVLKSEDEKLIIYNWLFPYKKGTYKYFAYIVYRADLKNNPQIIKLQDTQELTQKLEAKTLNQKNWYGCIYYRIINNKNIDNDYYTLLGWDGNNLLSNKKVIDVIKVNPNGIVQIGAPVFKINAKLKKRIVFEYSEESVMSLKYHPEFNKIVFDDLVPMSEQFAGVFEYYVPNLHTFNAFIAEKGKWIFEANTKITQPKTIKDNFYHNPNPEINKGF